MIIPISIARDGPIPNPVAPANPEATSAAALPYSPFIVLQTPKPTPVIAPIIGIFFNVDLVKETLRIFYTACFTTVRSIVGFTVILNPIFVISAIIFSIKSSK